MNHRERQILCGLFLSKFDRRGLDYFGFKGFVEAFNAFGYSLKAQPASIKNYRDELDPYFPNARRGWHKRLLRTHCRRVLDAYGDAEIERLGELIESFLVPIADTTHMPEVRRVLSIHDAETCSSFAKRLITGKAAEHYFAVKYSSIAEFSGMTLTDTTGCGCGFDFKLVPVSGSPALAVEVKGLRDRSGQVQLTDLEHDMADALRDRYYLVLVRNFAEEPFHTVINNPVHSALRFTEVERTEVRRSWCANVVE